MKKVLVIILVLLLIVASGALIIVHNATKDMTLAQDAQIEIVEGSGTAAIAQVLADNGLVADSRAFRLFARRQGVDDLFKAGSYTFAAGDWSMAEVCDKLIAGGASAGDQVWVTIVEGLTAGQTFQVLSEAGLGAIDNYLDYAANGDFSQYDFIPAAENIVAPGNRLDGFLFPDTYQMDPSWSEERVVDLLLAQFYAVWTSNGFDERADDMGYSTFDIVTMSSLVEKEAQIATDRPLIAGVFYQRLEIGMKLETCASIQFLLGEPKVDLTNADLAIDNPYNCYMYEGLPPGPIACPGLASLQAALYPTESDYLYFRARTDGSHRFSTTFQEHTTYHEGDQ